MRMRREMLKIDSPIPYSWWIQDSGSKTTSSLQGLHDKINYYLLLVLVIIIWQIWRIIWSSSEWSSKYINHGKWLELIWTVMPGLLLLVISVPSLSILYMQEELVSATVTVKVIGHQWYWSVEISDSESLSFESYIVSTENISSGINRLLEVDKSLWLPWKTKIRIIVSSTDVIHDLAIPSLSLKIDAIPGRLNQSWTEISRKGNYYGQCSELCGSEHGFMPFKIKSVSLEEYLQWLSELSENKN